MFVAIAENPIQEAIGPKNIMMSGNPTAISNGFDKYLTWIIHDNRTRSDSELRLNYGDSTGLEIAPPIACPAIQLVVQAL